MKKTTLVAIILSSGLVISTTTQAAVIQLLQDDLYMNVSVYWADGTGQTSVSNSSAFATPTRTQIELDLERVDGNGEADTQWAYASLDTSADKNFASGMINASDGFNDSFYSIYDAKADAIIDLDLIFHVSGDGATLNLGGSGNGFGALSFSLFDVTLDTLIAGGDNLESIDDIFNLLDEHIYTFNIGADLISTDDPDNVSFDLTFENARVVPVAEPSTLALFGLGLAGLLLAKRATSKKISG